MIVYTYSHPQGNPDYPSDHQRTHLFTHVAWLISSPEAIFKDSSMMKTEKRRF